MQNWKPTVIGGQPVANATKISPTVISAGAASPMPPKKIEVSALPGVQHHGVRLSESEFADICPKASAEVTGKAIFLLAAVDPHGLVASDCLNFATNAQAAVGQSVDRRLALVGEDDLRVAPRHLNRLHDLLSDLAASFQPRGLLRRITPHSAWAESKQEIAQLQTVLGDLQPKIAKFCDQFEALLTEGHVAQTDLDAHACAIEVLLRHVNESAASALAGRQVSLLSSITLLQQHLLSVKADLLNTQALLQQIQEGVLVRLPSVASAMTSIGQKPTETELFELREKITSIIFSIGRKS